MGSAPAILEIVGQSVWHASWQASALAVAVLAAVTLWRGRLSPAWRYVLWSLVLVRLLLPLAPPARWSPYNLAEGLGERIASAEPATAAGAALPVPVLVAADVSPSWPSGLEAPAEPILAPPAPDSTSEVPFPRITDPPKRWPALPFWPVVASIWLLGVIAMAARIGLCAWRLRRAARAWPEIADPRVLELLADGRRRLGLRRPVRLCVAPDETGPAVVGAWRPRIVLPEAVLSGFGRDRLEAILLHELAHVRRRDVVVHWLMTAARVLHWFNPIAWLALSRMGAEREQACDDVVIDVLGPSSRQLYGETMLRLLERLVVRPMVPGVVHFFGSRRRLRTRLESLTRPRRLAGHGKTIATALLVALALLGLTDRVRSKATARVREPGPTPLSTKADPAAVTPEPQKEAAEVRLQGRVLDHLGKPVAGADVLLLAGERLTVYANPGHPNAAVRLSWATEPANAPPSVKTDDQGRFVLRRPGTAANRVAVVSERILLWEVPIDRIPDAGSATIKLPQPGAIRIRCDIPRKPAKQEFQVFLRTFDGDDWEPDIIYLRDFEVPNPGEAVIGALPPAQYIVQRENDTDHGSWGILMTDCERRLLPVAAGRTTDTEYNRKTGRPVTGRVRGLEGMKLRYAEVSIGMLGPEEAPTPRGGRTRMFTHFDVMPIGPDGRFTTPPLPPGRYDLSLFAIRATTPRAGLHEGQRSDFGGGARINVPERGEVQPVEIVAKERRPEARAQAAKPDPQAPRLEVRARDETGVAVEDFEVRLYRPHASSPMAIGVDGVAVLTAQELEGGQSGDLVISGPIYATTVVPVGPIEGPRTIDVILRRGKLVRLHVRDAAGRPISAELMPLAQVYLERHRLWARDSFNDFYIDDEHRTRFVREMNFLNVRRMPGGDFGFRIPDDLAEPIYFAFSHPDVVRYFEAGPVTASRLREGTWNVVLPRPATVEVRLKPASGPDGKPLFAAAHYTLTPIIAGYHGGVPVLASGTLEAPAWSEWIRGLAPGAYDLHIQTAPRMAGATRDPQEAQAGVYRDRRKLDLKAGEPVSVVFDPPAFRPDAWRGNRTATVVIRPVGEGTLGGEDYRVRYTMPNYGLLPVASGKLKADGRIALDGIAPSGKEPYDGRYTVEVGGQQLGHFRVEDRPARQEFTLQMPPQVGDRAPDAMAIDFDLASRNARDLEDDFYNRLAKEHEFNNPRWPFVIKVRDVQDRALIDATFKHRVKGKDEFDLVIQAKKAVLHVDPGAKVLHVQLDDAETQHYRHGSDLVLINNRTLAIPLPLEISTADFRGRIVFLEFWATWCGPCREPMQRLVDLARRRGGEWSKDVALVAVGIDQDREPFLREVQQQGPTAIRHLWSPADEARWSGTAGTAYAVSAVPTAFLIDRDGRIVWRGHPGSLEIEREIEKLRARGHR